MTRTIRLFALSLALMAGAFSQAAAQATSGTISGVVTDERQGAIANATVTARNVGTNESRVTTVDGQGRYRFSNLPVGNYELIVQANGFAKTDRTRGVQGRGWSSDEFPSDLRRPPRKLPQARFRAL